MIQSVPDTVLLISPSGENLGNVTKETAEKIAEERFGLDLVEVRPGVYKILDLGKLQYEASKRKQTKAKQTKEMKFKLNIGEADYQMKVNHIRRFLKEGHNVRVTIWFSGREVSRPEVGIMLMRKISLAVSDIATVSSWNPELQGKNMFLSIQPGVKK
jgi:translation initiation factor IF-3